MNGGDTYSRDGGGGRHGGSSRHYSSRGGDRDDRRDRDRRRRSRSPRNSRRDYEVDTYSSSRNYREREREDTYARREDRRDDRAWDRPTRRDPRRDDDDRHSRRDRDPLEDRGGGGRGRRDRDGFGGRDRKKSNSPPFVKKREKTPDLTNVVSILERERRLTQWDIKPAGYENITAEQAKLSGMFPLPGAPRTQPMDPSRLQAFMNQPAGSASTSALKPANAKQAKRLLVHNLPQSATNDSIADFFNLHMNGVNVVSGSDPCISAHLSQDKTFAVLEFKTAEDATYALALDGIPMQDLGDMQVDRPGLSIRRPKEYIAPSAPEDNDAPEGQLLSVVKDGPNKISVTNIPIYIDADQMIELFKAFGELKAFVLAQEIGSDSSRGIAFCEYTTDEGTAIALEGLNGMELGDGHLKAQRASVGITQAAGLETGVNAMTMLAGTTTADSDESRVVMLMNMVNNDELMDTDVYNDICEDVKEECQKYGTILDFKVPRPKGPRQDPGVGKIYVKYSRVEEAQTALKNLAGRKFADRTVVATFFSEEFFDVNAW